MQRAFTLLELLTVIAIMGILGTASIGGYQAVTRGMSERAALDVAKNIADTTRQRANLDCCRTYLFLYNEVQSLESEDEPGKVCGVAIAVKGAGRISAVDGTKWFDEFGDLDRKFRSMEKDGEPLTDDELAKKATKFRLFKLSESGQYAVVRDGVYNELQEVDLEERTGEAEWATRTIRRYGFQKLSGDAAFVVGEEYGKEFSVVRLPEGYTFSQTAKMSSESDLGLQFVRVEKVEWDANSSPTLTVFARRPDGKFEEIGKTSQVRD